MFEKLILVGGSFYNVYVKGIFCERFMQHCHVSVNMKNVGLVVSPYFTSDVPRRFFIPVYWHGHQKKKYTFIYSDIFHHMLCFFFLNLSKVCFQVRNYTSSIMNHPKA